MQENSNLFEKHSMYCYENEDVLKNNFNLHDNDSLAKKEAEICGNKLFVFNFVFNDIDPYKRIEDLKKYFDICKNYSDDLTKENEYVQTILKEIEEILDLLKAKSIFSFEVISMLNSYLLKDIYPFAGEKRWEDTTKYNITYCRASYISDQLERAFKQIKEKFNNLDIESIPSFLAETYSDLHIIHPFREGNTRALKMYMKLLMYKRNQKEESPCLIDYSSIEDSSMKKAIIVSDYTADTRLLEDAFRDSLIRINKKKGLQR